MSLSASKDRAGIIHQILQQMLQKTFPWKTTFPPTTVWSFTPILILVPKAILKSQLSPPDPPWPSLDPESVWHSGADHAIIFISINIIVININIIISTWSSRECLALQCWSLRQKPSARGARDGTSSSRAPSDSIFNQHQHHSNQHHQAQSF